MRQESDLFCLHKCMCAPFFLLVCAPCVCVYSCARLCLQGQSKWRCIIRNHSEHGHCSSQARQSDHLRGCPVYGLWPKASCLLLYASLALYPLMPLSNAHKTPGSHGHHPLSSLSSPCPFSSLPLLPPVLYLHGGRKDKVMKINIEKWKWKRERDRESWNEPSHLDISPWAAVVRG